jgi:glycolate oxidase
MMHKVIREKDIKKRLLEILDDERVSVEPLDLLAYSYDASLDRAMPVAVAYPITTSEVQAIVRLCYENGIPFLARGAGTNLSGGSLALHGGVVIVTTLMNRILDIDPGNRCAVVEPGVFNLDLQEALKPLGYFFAPDPASQQASTIGGNAAENAGGPHGVAYGVTGNHVLGMKVVLPEGRVIEFGGKAPDRTGYDVLGIMVGSEGTLGIITELTVRILPLPERVETLLAVFDDLDDASRAVSGIIAAGILPACLEMMDRPIIRAVQESMNAGLPEDAESILIIELEGPGAGMERQAELIRELLERNNVREVRMAKDDSERERIWEGRRGAFSAITRIKPHCLLNDGTVPRNRLPEVLHQVMEVGKKYDFLIGNVFHAGDGNLHPVILFDASEQGMKERVLEAGLEILRLCVEAGGTISGEHGIGTEKKRAMRFMFSEADLRMQKRLKDVFDRKGLLNPGKIFPEE